MARRRLERREEEGLRLLEQQHRLAEARVGGLEQRTQPRGCVGRGTARQIGETGRDRRERLGLDRAGEPDRARRVAGRDRDRVFDDDMDVVLVGADRERARAGRPLRRLALDRDRDEVLLRRAVRPAGVEEVGDEELRRARGD